MSKGRKAKGSVNNEVEVYRHETDKRKNAVPVGLASYDTAKPKPKKHEYDPHLDPQLACAGKAERISFEVSDKGSEDISTSLNDKPSIIRSSFGIKETITGKSVYDVIEAIYELPLNSLLPELKA
jgi:hypothetical protein